MFGRTDRDTGAPYEYRGVVNARSGAIQWLAIEIEGFENGMRGILGHPSGYPDETILVKYRIYYRLGLEARNRLMSEGRLPGAISRLFSLEHEAARLYYEGTIRNIGKKCRTTPAGPVLTTIGYFQLKSGAIYAIMDAFGNMHYAKSTELIPICGE